jgi:hypothetical protein
MCGPCSTRFPTGEGEALARELEEVELAETSYGGRLASQRGSAGHGDRMSALGIAALKAAQESQRGPQIFI